MDKFLVKSPSLGVEMAPAQPAVASVSPLPKNASIVSSVKSLTPLTACSNSDTTPTSTRSVRPSLKTPKRKSKSSTPKSSQSKTGWTVMLLKMGKKIQMHILCRKSRGGIGPFTSAESASKNRPIWEPVTFCQLVNEGENKKFLFTNSDNEQEDFRIDLMDPLMTPVSSFNQKLAALLLQSPRLLAVYLTLLSHSEKFCNFSPESHNKLGFGSDIGEDAVKQLGGSISDYKELLRAAIESTTVIGDKDDQHLKISPMTKKRKLTDYFNKTDKKLNNSEKTEQRFQEMVNEEGGLEKSVVSSYVKCQSIPLDKLSVSPDLFLPINLVKVNKIAESMIERLEVSQLSLVPGENVLRRVQKRFFIATSVVETVIGKRSHKPSYESE